MTKKKRKLKKKALPLLIIIFFVLLILIFKIAGTNIKNIYVSGNEIYSDQEIIDIAKISDYPNTFNNLSYSIKKRLENNILIEKAEVHKKGLFSVYIKVMENYPLFYYQVDDNTILKNGKKTKDIKADITVVNQIPDTVYNNFYNKMKLVNHDILSRISEIKYSPNDVDEERFFLTMNDGNYVYLTIDKFETINKYIDIVKKFDNKKGILYLDAGEYFELFN